jgi:hypothetical protein
MKSLKFSILLLFLLVGTSCHNNKLKTDKKALVQQILTEEEQLAQQEKFRVEKEKLLSDSLAKLPKGFRFKEDRSVDLQKPPVVIDIAGSLENISEVKLSDVASDIKYIRMDKVPDVALPTNLKYKYYLMDNYIVALNIYGTHLFSKEGKFIRTIVKNQLTGVEFDEKNNYLKFWMDYTSIGGGTSVWSRGNSLFYIYSNNISGQRYIMEYECTQDQPVLSTGFDPENQNKITGLGKVLIDMNHGKTTPPAPRKHQGMWSNSPEGMYSSLGVFAPDRNTYMQAVKSRKAMLGVFNQQGDTLVTFVKLEQLKNYTKSLMRGTDWGSRYEKGGNYFFRTDFNDTIFQVIPPNRILPVYVLNLGKYKVSKQEGVDPGVSLEGKIIPQEWADTKDFIFMTFTKDNYDCPNTRKTKSVKIYYALFSKKSGKLQIVKNEPTDYAAPILKNDLDGGYPVWPLSYMVGNKGELMLSLKGNDLKSRVKGSQYQNSTATAEKKENLKQLANSVNDQDDILMIVQ